MKGTIIAALLFCVSSFAQTFSPVQPVDFSNTTTKPNQTGLLSARPATCSVGQQYFSSDAVGGQNLSQCTATNVWAGLSSTMSDQAVATGTQLLALCASAVSQGKALALSQMWDANGTCGASIVANSGG